MIAFTKEKTKANEEVLKNEKKLQEGIKENADKEVEIAKDKTDKLKGLSKSYYEKTESIAKASAEKIKAIDESIAENRAKTISDKLSLETSTEEKIRNIRKKGMTDVQKESSDRKAAFDYLARGRILLAQAESEKDKEKLDRGKDLIKQGESLASGLNNQSDAVAILNQSLSGLKKAADIDGQIKDLELLEKKNKEISDAADKQAAAKKEYDYKTKIALESFSEIARKEEERWAKEKKNLMDAITLYKEKARIATGRISTFTVKDTSSISDKNADSINKETKAIEAQKSAVKSVGTEWEENNKKFIVTSASEASQNIFDGLTSSANQVWESNEKGVRSFTDAATYAGESAANAFKKFGDTVVNPVIEPKIKMSPAVPFRDGIENMKNLFNGVVDLTLDKIFSITAKVVGLDDIENLVKEIDKLKDKAVTITTKYVTKGTPYSGSSGYKDGGRLPGFGGGDRRPALLEDGEWIINKHAVRKFGDDFMSSINNMTLPKFATGGRVNLSPQPVTKSSSILGSLANFGTVSLDTGNAQIPALIQRDVLSELTTHLNTLKRFST